MAYTLSKAQTGSQTLFQINTGTTTTPIWTPIYEITEISQSGKSNATADTTNLQSLATEWLPTLTSEGEFDISANRVSNDPGQIAVLASFNAKTIIMYEIQLPKTLTQTVSGDLYAFSAGVVEYEDLSSLSPTKQIMVKAKIKVSGPVVVTAGT